MKLPMSITLYRCQTTSKKAKMANKLLIAARYLLGLLGEPYRNAEKAGEKVCRGTEVLL